MPYPATGDPLMADDGYLPPHYDYYWQRRELLYRNGRWGTCVLCPRRDGRVYPEECVETRRYDHQIARDGGTIRYSGNSHQRRIERRRRIREARA